jgi:hypothetical protein
MQPTLHEIEEAIVESSKTTMGESLKDLRNRLNQLGYNFPDTREGEKKAYRKARNFWWEIREKKHPLNDFYVTDLTELPGTTVSIDGVKYMVHGICHSGLFFGKTSDAIKEFVGKKVEDHHNPTEHKVCFYEEGFDEDFRLSKGYDFHDLEFSTKAEWEDVLNKKGILKDLLASLSENFHWGEMYYPLTFFSKKTRMVHDTRTKALKDIRFLPKFREVDVRMYLPEPLTIDYFSHFKFLSRELSERSLYMTQKMREKGNEANEIHALVGMTHEMQMEYLLRNDIQRI